MDIEIRLVEAGQWEELARMLSVSFGETPRADEMRMERRIFDTARTVAAYDGAEMVGAAAECRFEMTVPGGSLPTSGVVSVATLPTHRRRGVMRSLLSRQMEEFHDAGQPVAYLWASEGAIYQRFGYGVGTLNASFEIERHQTALLRPVEVPGRIRLLGREEALKAFPSVYERVLPTRPGMLARDELWWEYVFRDTQDRREGASGLFYVVNDSPDGLDGYAAYRIKEDWSTGTGPNYTLLLEELMAATDEAYAGLWRYCFDVDLVRRATGWKRPVDEPLLHMLAEPRALRFQVRDGTWLRIVEVPGALEGRGYGAAGRLVLEVRDGFCPWNQGRFELEGGPDGASCRPTDAEPDLALDVADLGATYLGGVRFLTLARAGRVEERTEGALRLADAMFASDVAPWCPHVF